MITACKAQARSSTFEISQNPLWYASCGFTIESYASIDAEAGDAPFQKMWIYHEPANNSYCIDSTRFGAHHGIHQTSHDR
jgi:hypothetical protein